MTRDKKSSDTKGNKKSVKPSTKKVRANKKSKHESIKVEETSKAPQINEVKKPKVKTVRDLLMEDILDKYKMGELKIADIDVSYFTDTVFYNQIVELAKEKVMEKFQEITLGIKTNDTLTAELTKALNKKLDEVVDDLKTRRSQAFNAMRTNGI